MRVAVYLLLFANIAMFAWAAWIDTPPRAVASAAAKGLPQLVLASDVDAKRADAPAPGNTAPASGRSPSGTAASPATALRCASVGPFELLEQADAATALLRSRGYEPRQREAEGERFDGYWVYVGNLKSDLEEARVMRTLIQASLSDARIMPLSDEGRRISVGLFSERVRAERRARSLRRLGLEPQIGERRAPGTVHWIDLELRPNEATLSTEGLLATDTPGAHLEVRSCPP